MTDLCATIFSIKRVTFQKETVPANWFSPKTSAQKNEISEETKDHFELLPKMSNRNN